MTKHLLALSLASLLVACAATTQPLDAAVASDATGPVGDATAVRPTDPSPGCGGPSPYASGTTVARLAHGGLVRSFRVHVPPGYTAGTPAPLVLMFHGGGGSGQQLETASSNMSPIADREGFVAVYPDGTGAVPAWNAGSCCGAPARDEVDDVGFVAALLDELEASLCLDRRRVFAAGMSNGAMLTHRLACELGDRIAAVAPVAGVDETSACSPARPVAIFHVHGRADGHVPWEGGVGCGPSGVDYTSVPESIDRWRIRNGCSDTTGVAFEEGDGRCEAYSGCVAGGDVTLCTITAGGHSWPGGVRSEGRVDCPGDGTQSATFFASEAIWAFFAAHGR